MNDVVIEVDIVRYKNTVFGDFCDFFCNLEKPWLVSNHCLGNSSKICYECRNGCFWIDQCCKFVQHLFSIKNKDRDFGDLLPLVSISRSFYIYNCVPSIQSYFLNLQWFLLGFLHQKHSYQQPRHWRPLLSMHWRFYWSHHHQFLFDSLNL